MNILKIIEYFENDYRGKEYFKAFVNLLEIETDEGCDLDFVMSCFKQVKKDAMREYYESRLDHLNKSQ